MRVTEETERERERERGGVEQVFGRLLGFVVSCWGWFGGLACG